MKQLNKIIIIILTAFLTNTSLAQDPNFYIFLCFGQSNMEGNATIPAADKVGIDNRFQVLEAVNCSNLNRSMGQWYTAVPPLCRCYTGLTPVDEFGRTLVANLPSNIKVGVVHVAVGGCKIELFDKDTYSSYLATAEDWLKNTAKEYNSNPYGRLVDMARIAQQDGVIKGILLHQGESNTGDQQWPNKVKKIYNDLMSDLNLNPNNVPLLAGEVVHANQGGVCASMNGIIANLPGTLPNSYVISSDGCTDGSDNLHFDAAGYHELGKRYAMKMLELLPSPTNPVVTIESPEEGDISVAPSTFTITASASDPDGTIQSVAFYANDQLIQQKTNAPYIVNWTANTAGTYEIKAIATDNTGDTGEDIVTVKVNVPQQAYGGTPHAIPGTIQIEEYDIGGNGYAYFDDSPGTSVDPAPNFRGDEDVDLETCTDDGGGYNLGWSTAGEWLEYTVHVATSGTYNLIIRAACNGDGRTINIDIDEVAIAPNIAITNTGDWQVWTNITVNDIQLTAGEHIMKLTIGATDYVNLNYIKFDAIDLGPTVSITSPANGSEFDASETVNIVALATSTNSTITSVSFFAGTELLYTDNSSPYSYDWSGMSIGTYDIKAETTDANNKKGFSTISISITEAPIIHNFKAGWNFIGYPYSGSESVETALGSIWQYVDMVKDFDGFYDSNGSPALNSLLNMEWGKGYLVKVKSDCNFQWSK